VPIGSPPGAGPAFNLQCHRSFEIFPLKPLRGTISILCAGYDHSPTVGAGYRDHLAAFSFPADQRNGPEDACIVSGDLPPQDEPTGRIVPVVFVDPEARCLAAYQFAAILVTGEGNFTACRVNIDWRGARRFPRQEKSFLAWSDTRNSNAWMDFVNLRHAVAPRFVRKAHFASILPC
jgi:hypothetical protein